jgi:hypothetical protein
MIPLCSAIHLLSSVLGGLAILLWSSFLRFSAICDFKLVRSGHLFSQVITFGETLGSLWSIKDTCYAS